MRRIAFLLVLLLSALSAHAVEVVDDRGVAVSLARPPQRIVSLLPSLSETVCALGQCRRLVGVDRYSTYPDALRRLAQVGGGLDPDLEAIVALKPDLVLMSSANARATARLAALGLQVAVLDADTHADVRRVLDKVGALLDVPDAGRVWAQAEAGVAAAAAGLPAAARTLRVYYEVGAGPYAAGASSFIGETLARLGVQNIVPAGLGPFPELNPEYVVKADPDLIMVAQRDFPGMQDRPGWRGIRAVREQRICVFSDAEDDVLVRPGPRLAEGARIMARCIAQKGLGQVAGPIK